MFKRLTILFSLFCLLLALPKNSNAQTFQVNDQLHFVANNQSMWGPTPGFTLNMTQNLFNVGFGPINQQIGSIGSIFGFPVGVQINIGAGFGLRAYFQISGFSAGSVDVDYPINITLDVPNAGTYDKGETITINTEYTVQEPPAELLTHFPTAGTLGLYIDLSFQFSLGGRICLGACINLPGLNVNLNTTIPIFEVSPQYVTYPCVLVTPCGSLPRPPCIPSICTTQLLPATISQPSLGITLFLDVPNVQTTSQVTANKCLAANGEYTYVVLTLDLLRYLEIFAGFIPPPAGPIIAAVIGNLSGSISLPFGASLTYTIFSAEMVMGLTMRQEFSYCPIIYGNLEFPVPVPFFETDINNNIIGSGLSNNVPFEVGNDVHITYPCYFDFMDVIPTYSETNDFKNRTYDSLSVNLALRAIEFHLNVPSITLIPRICFPQICIPRICIPFLGCTPRICTPAFCTPAVVTPPINIGFGPLWTYNPQLASITWDYFDDNWEIIGTETSTSTPFQLDALEFFATMSNSIDVYCYGDSSGEATVTVTNGEQPYTYKWSNGVTIIDPSNVNTMTGLNAGIHFVRVTNSFGCQAFAEMRIAEPQQPLALLSSTVNNSTCNGQANGSITVQAQGGKAPYTFNWSDGQTGATAINLLAGSYDLTISDNNGCEIYSNFIVTEPSVLSAVLTGTDVSCFGGNDGTITANVNGGLIAYNYLWSNGEITNTISNLTSGTYTLTITDGGNCQLVETLSISEPQTALSVSFTSVDVLCNGVNTGSIDLTIGGGTAPYQVQWSGSNGVVLSSRNEDIFNLYADTYLAVVTDDHGCTISQTATISQPQTNLSSSWQITNVDCKGNSTGAIDLNITGGTAPYTYNWSNGASTQNINSIATGAYTVTISDNNACSISESMSVTEPIDVLSANLTTQNISCAAGNNGNISTSVNGGTAPYTYNWSNSSTNPNLNNLAIGSYTVTITDKNNCSVSLRETLTEPGPLSLSHIQTNISCNADNDGSIDLTISGGVAPYVIEWTNSDNIILNRIAPAIFNLTADTYKATVYDANNCILTLTATLTEPAELISDLTGTNITCFGAGNGSISSNVTGGTAPYTYNWSSGSSSNNLTSLIAGTYTLTVVDAMGCSIINTSQINQPTAIQASSSKEDINCKDANTGKILTNVFGGTAPYTYNWSNGNVSQHAYNLTAGAYTLTITDDRGCSLIINDTITEPTSTLHMSSTGSAVNCYGGSDGNIATKVVGGLPPYTFVWADTLSLLNNNQADIEGLKAGDYLVKVIDSKGCELSEIVTVGQPEPIRAEVNSVDASCTSGSDGKVYVQPTGGTPPYHYNWSGGTSTTDTLENLEAGIHKITVYDARQCEYKTEVEIFEPRPIEINLEEIIPMSCFDREDGEIKIQVDGARGNISYLWSNGETTKDLSNVGVGIYYVTATDQYNCFDTLKVIIEPTDVECVRIPNSFTPNGDGVNDTWEIENIDQFSTYFLKIYNKWGNVLFETTDYSKNWDGTFNGKKLPSDTYYFVIDLGDGNGQVTGTITIVR